MWTHFWDMHSGGGQKENFAHCYIEAPVDEAKAIFYHRFGHNPERVTCTCCGEDYSINEEQELDQLTAYHRNCDYVYFINGEEVSQEKGWKPGKGLTEGASARYVERASQRYSYRGNHIPLDEYLKSDDVHVIYAADIKPEERVGEIPAQGYIWRD